MSNLKKQDNKEVNFGTTPKTLGSYIVGFILCIALTLIPFAVVAKRTLPMGWIAAILAICALYSFWCRPIASYA